jgi:hypothetical protein
METAAMETTSVEAAATMEAASAAMTSTCQRVGGGSQSDRSQCRDRHYRFAYHRFVLSCAWSPQPQRPQRDCIISDAAKV